MQQQLQIWTVFTAHAPTHACSCVLLAATLELPCWMPHLCAVVVLQALLSSTAEVMRWQAILSGQCSLASWRHVAG